MLMEQKKIVVLFLDSSPNLSLTTADLQTWFEGQFEIGLIADTEAVVIPAPTSEPNNEIWKKILDELVNRKNTVKAFVVISHLESLLTTSAALSFMIQGLEKPLIFTSSPNSVSYEKTSELTQDFGIRANLLNALQVATLPLQESAIVFGNRIIRANRAVRSYDSSINLFQAFQEPLLGTIDFGVHLTEKSRRTGSEFKIVPKIEQNIFILDAVFTGSGTIVPENAKGIIAKGVLAPDWVEQYAKGKPVFMWNPSGEAMTWEAAVVKFAWVLGQTQNPAEVGTLMARNVAGELGD